jgi:hypothetical protein
MAVGAVHASVAVVINPITTRLISALKHRGIKGRRGGASLYTMSGLSTVGVIAVGQPVLIVVDVIETVATLAVFAGAYEQVALTGGVVTVHKVILIIIEPIGAALVGVLSLTTHRHKGVLVAVEVFTIAEAVVVVINPVTTRLI